VDAVLALLPGMRVGSLLGECSQKRLDEGGDGGFGGFDGGFVAEVAEGLAGDGAYGREEDSWR